MPEGEKTVLDRCAVVYVHEHAEANQHKNNGMSLIGLGIFWQQVVKGLVLLAAVYVDVTQKAKG